MGREAASAAARWVHLAELGVRPGSWPSATRTPRSCAGTSGSSRARPWSRTTETCSPTRAWKRSTARFPITCTRSSTSPAGGQAPPGREAVRDRRHRERGRQRRDRAPSRAARFPPPVALLPRRPAGLAVDYRAPRRARARGPSAFLHSSDLDPQKPINWKRRAELNGEYGVMGDLGMHALHLPLEPAGSPGTCARSSPTSSPSGRTAREARLRATRGTTLSSSARWSTTATRFRCASRRSGSLPARRTRGSSRWTARTARSPSRRRRPRRSNGWITSRAVRSPGAC